MRKDNQRNFQDEENSLDDADEEFFTSGYSQRLSRFDTDSLFRHFASVHERFKLPGDAETITKALHDNPPMSIPPPPDFDMSFAWEDSAAEVQRFIFRILTLDTWKAWDGRPLAEAWPAEIHRFCVRFRPKAVALNTVTELRQLGVSDASRQGATIFRLPEEVGQLFQMIVWLHVCELRELVDQDKRVWADIQQLYAKHRPVIERNVTLFDTVVIVQNPVSGECERKKNPFGSLKKRVQSTTQELLRAITTSKRWKKPLAPNDTAAGSDSPVVQAGEANLQAGEAGAGMSLANGLGNCHRASPSRLSLVFLKNQHLNRISLRRPNLQAHEEDAEPTNTNGLGSSHQATVSRWSLTSVETHNLGRMSLLRLNRNRFSWFSRDKARFNS
jgi:hypothetical protein